MEELSMDGKMFSRIGILRDISIGFIPEYRSIIMCHMYSYLMGSPCFDLTFEKGIFLPYTFS